MNRPTDDVVDRFRANLWRCRRRAALSQEQVAELAGLHRTEIGMLESGARVPRIDTLVKLMGSLEVSANELLDGIEWLPARERREGTFWTRTAQGSRRETTERAASEAGQSQAGTQAGRARHQEP
jgi:transcriptional regulator with XRE-family HTH domain